MVDQNVPHLDVQPSADGVHIPPTEEFAADIVNLVHEILRDYRAGEITEAQAMQALRKVGES